MKPVKKPRQLSLIKKEKIEIQFGGEKPKVQSRSGSAVQSGLGKRKVRRPLSVRQPMHLILKSGMARGRYAFAPSRHDLKQFAQKTGRRFSVQIFGVALNWSHIHMVVRVPSRLEYVRFIRALTGGLGFKAKSREKLF